MTAENEQLSTPIALSRVDDHFVKLYRQAGEILWWLTVKTACPVELSAISQAFKFRITRRTADGHRIAWQYCLPYTDIDQSRYACTAEQWANFISVKWNEEPEPSQPPSPETFPSVTWQT